MMVRARLSAAIVATCAVMCAVGVPLASADGDEYCSSCSLGAMSRVASGTHSQLTSSEAWSDCSCHEAGVSAHEAGSWNEVYGYLYGYGYACFNIDYRNLGAISRNPHTVSQWPWEAIAGYNGGAGPKWC
jgi:hypothetical protein